MTKRDVLIVDDNPVNMKLVSFLLSAAGYQVRTATSASDARRAIDDAVPELILMDIQLPGTDGLALTRELRASPRTAAVIIVAVTAYAMKGDEEKALAAGCDAYVTKPIDTRHFPGRIAALLSRGRPEVPT